MKDIIITSQKIKRERNFYFLSLLLAFITNIIAIVIYKRSFIELISQIGYVFFVSIVIYVLLLIPRILIYSITCFIRKKK